MDYTFDSKFEICGDFKADWEENVVKNEPMLFNCDYQHAYELGGPITREFLVGLPEEWKNDVVVDSRVHMLMHGFYPAIPGYHHDDVPRSTENGQPNYDNPEYHSEHVMGLVNGHVCPTIFAVGKHQLPKISSDIIYKEWHKVVEHQIWKGVLKTEEAPSGKYIKFDCNAMHTAQMAKESGWRWFIRVSRNTDRTKKVTNEIRRQVNVYLENPMQGW